MLWVILKGLDEHKIPASKFNWERYDSLQEFYRTKEGKALILSLYGQLPPTISLDIYEDSTCLTTKLTPVIWAIYQKTGRVKQLEETNWRVNYITN